MIYQISTNSCSQFRFLKIKSKKNYPWNWIGKVLSATRIYGWKAFALRAIWDDIFFLWRSSQLKRVRHLKLEYAVEILAIQGHFTCSLFYYISIKMSIKERFVPVIELENYVLRYLRLPHPKKILLMPQSVFNVRNTVQSAYYNRYATSQSFT